MRRLAVVLVLVAAGAVGAPAAHATRASIAITGGGLTMSTPSVRLISRNPAVLEATTTVTDARGTGSGWVISLGANSPSAASDGSLLITRADATCVTGSACTLPINPVSYPLTASLSGTRTVLFEANPSSGMGAQLITARVVVPTNFRSGLNLNVSISTPPSAGGALRSPSPSCSISDLVATGKCPEVP
ncbi:MAG TPA: hypothetical protein VMB27_18390 [Solirubrobacteraceae bacterium]|nr:hypothetical protein [Solirubrobacteraceae bacterium]